jgi:hypothetical protein
MKNCKSLACILGLVLAFILAAAGADKPPLTFKFTTAGVPGALVTTPGGINNAGATAGQYEDSSKVFHGYILSGKNLTSMDDPNGTGKLFQNPARSFFTGQRSPNGFVFCAAPSAKSCILTNQQRTNIISAAPVVRRWELSKSPLKKPESLLRLLISRLAGIAGWKFVAQVNAFTEITT